MEIYHFTSTGGKDVIKAYVDKLPKADQLHFYEIESLIRANGIDAIKDSFQNRFRIKPIEGKLWEIKISQDRIFYVLKDKDSIYFLHMCKKQKGKTENKDKELAYKRAKTYKLI